MEGATILPPAQRWRWRGDDHPERITYWPAERLVLPKRSFGTREAGELAEAMGGMLKKLSRTFAPLRCPITGGRGSRMLTGLMMANEQPTDYFTKGEQVPRPRTIFVRRDVSLGESSVAHELCHVIQWERHGLSLPLIYLWQWVRAGFVYSRIPLELEAGRAETEPFDVCWALDLISAMAPGVLRAHLTPR